MERERAKKLLKQIKPHRGKSLDRLAESIHDQVFAKTDCLECAACCKGIPPIVTAEDSRRISSQLGMNLPEFKSAYLTVDEDGDTVMNASPCPFLQEDNKCRIYECRPTACREYPHMDGRQFSANLSIHADNAVICPAADRILEEINQALPD